MRVTFASNVETHYMGCIIVCPEGEKAILQKRRGGWCYIDCKLKTASSGTPNDHTNNNYTWGTLRVPVIYLNIDENQEAFTADDLNPLECVAYNNSGSALGGVNLTDLLASSSTSVSSTDTSTVDPTITTEENAGSSSWVQALNAAKNRTKSTTETSSDRSLIHQRVRSDAAVLESGEIMARADPNKRSSLHAGTALLQNLKPTKDTSKTLILNSVRSRDSAAIFDQLVESNTIPNKSQSATTPRDDHTSSPRDFTVQSVPIVLEQPPEKVIVEEQPFIIKDVIIEESPVDVAAEPVIEKKPEEPIIEPVVQEKEAVVPNLKDQYAEQEDDLETFDAETETDADYIMPFSRQETFDNNDFDLEDLLLLSEMEGIDLGDMQYEPNVDDQLIEIYKSKHPLPNFFNFDQNTDQRKKKLLQHITLQHAAKKLVDVGKDYDLKLAIQQGLAKARGKLTNRKATIFSDVSPLQYQAFKKYSVEEAGKVIYRAFTDWWTLKQFFNYMKTAPEYKQARLRQHCLKEILSTERSYVAQLETLYYDFFVPMKKNHYSIFSHYSSAPNISASNVVSRDQLSSEDQFKIIFSNIEQILKTNTALLHDLEMDFKIHYPRNHFPSIYKKILPFLKVYTVYVNNYDKANELVEELTLRNSKFAEFLDSVYEKKGVTLQSLLITPVQRIPRVKMLFVELLKRTVSEHEEYKVIEETMVILNEIAMFVNEKKRSDENNQIFLRLQQIMQKRYKTLITPSRKFLKRDDFKVVCTRKFLNSNCEVYLCNDMMVVIPMTPDRGLRIDFTSMIFFTFSEMEPKTEEELNDEEVNEFIIKTFIRNSVFTFKFTAMNGSERIRWEKDIRELIDIEHTRCKKYGINTSGVSALLEEVSKENGEATSPPSTSRDPKEIRDMFKDKDEILIQERRMRLYNRSKINSSKYSTSHQQHKNVKQEMYTLGKTVREQKNQLAELEKTIKQNEDKYKLAEAEFAELEKRMLQMEEEKKSTDNELVEVDSKIMATIGNDCDAFMEIFGSDPVCTSTKDKVPTRMERLQAKPSFRIVGGASLKDLEESKEDKPIEKGENRRTFSGGIDGLEREKELIIPSLALDTRRMTDAEFHHTSGSTDYELDMRGSKSARGNTNSSRSKTTLSMSFGTHNSSGNQNRKSIFAKAKGILGVSNAEKDRLSNLKRSTSSGSISNDIVFLKPVGAASPVADAPKYGLPTLSGSVNTMPSLPLFLSKKSNSTTSIQHPSTTGHNTVEQHNPSDTTPNSPVFDITPQIPPLFVKSPRKHENFVVVNGQRVAVPPPAEPTAVTPKPPSQKLLRIVYSLEEKRPFHYNHDTIESFLDLDARSSPKHAAKRVAIEAMSTTLNSYEELDLDKLTTTSAIERYDDMSENEERESKNPLYRIKPLPQWNTIEQEELNFRYISDRTSGDKYYVTKPVAIVVGKEVQDDISNIYLNDEKELEEMEKLPDSTESLKLLIMKLQKECSVLKQHVFIEQNTNGITSQ